MVAVDAEAEALRLDPRIVTVWRVQGFLLALGVGAVAGVTTAVSAQPYLPLAFGLALAGCAAAWLWPPMRYRRWTYAVRDAGIELCRGVVVRRQQLVPYFRVQHVDISHGPIDRRMGLCQLVINTASAATNAQLPGLTDASASALRDLLLARAGVGDGV